MLTATNFSQCLHSGAAAVLVGRTSYLVMTLCAKLFSLFTEKRDGSLSLYYYILIKYAQFVYRYLYLL